MRAALFGVALILLTSPPRCGSILGVRGIGVAERRGVHKAVVAVARKLAIVFHRMWRDGTDSRWLMAQAV